ncbi:hypothetical protein [Terrabacter sp. NPDC000476]|uniref:hypothetical protein n=1 Tax=Terrabacter sp. NPDC000476 TaxID=3154258 RepID=UPI003334098B
MSYDLEVFARRPLASDGLRDLLAASSGLHVGPSTPGCLTVLRGARGNDCFTLDGPAPIDPEDVPAEVSAVLLDASYLYRIAAVEGSAEVSIQHAIRFARRLAESTDGAVVDQQTERVWSRSRSRSFRRPEPTTRVDVVELEWFCLRADIDDGTPTVFLETVERHLPEALPRRFGEHEPLQGRYDDGGAEGFLRSWRDATSFISFTGTGVCADGAMDAGPADEFSGPFWSMSLSVHAEALRSPDWREAARRVFLALADGLPAFYACATVTRDHIWSGRSLRADGRTESVHRPLERQDSWMGLPPRTPWWTWLGTPYREVASLLPARRVTATRVGVLWESAPDPAPADSLEPLSVLLPAEHFATPTRSTRWGPASLTRALSIPDALRG